MKHTLTMLLGLAVLSGAFLWNGCAKKTTAVQPDIAVANSYLSAAVNDLCGDQQPVFDLVPPGMCPGHFDISPSQVNALCHCKMLFVFDFQQNIEKTIPRIKERGLKVYSITPSAGMCIPETYLSVVKQVADALSQQQPEQKTHYESRIKEIEKRLAVLSQTIADRIKQSGLQKTTVMTSGHQAEFATWLGLDCVTTFAGRDTITPAQIDASLQEARQHPIQLVIANQQEGTGMAKTLAGHLNVKHVVFSNFPNDGGENAATAGFDRLLTDNIDRLIEAMQ